MATAESAPEFDQSGPKSSSAKSPKDIGSQIFDRQPPCNLEAEKGILGSIMLLPDVLDEVALIVRPEDFYDEANQKIYAQMQALHDGGRKVDPTLLFEQLKMAGDFELVGGAAYLFEIGRCVPNAAHAVYYSEIVKDKATLRGLIHASTDILRDSYDETVKAREMLSRAEEKVFAILDSKGSGQLHTINDVLMESMDRINARMDQAGTVGGVPTGLTELDGLLGGLHDSELIIIAARPSMGKTALAMNIAEHASMREDTCVLFVSLEMSCVELGDRLLCSVARVDGRRLRDGTISQDDRHKLIEASADISSSQLFVDDSPSRTMTEIAATARRLKRRDNLGLIIVDYLQLIDPDNSKDPRQEQVAKIARRLKGMARELKIPVVCLAQLNRQAEASKDNKPRLSHLRESGAIEQDADVVMFVHREEYYQTNEEDRKRVEGEAELIVSKQRNGPIGDVKLTWLHKHTRFEDAAARPYDELEIPDSF